MSRLIYSPKKFRCFVGTKYLYFNKPDKKQIDIKVWVWVSIMINVNLPNSRENRNFSGTYLHVGRKCFVGNYKP